MTTHTVEGYAGVLALDTPQTNQRWTASKTIDWHGKQAAITVALRFDDSCKNGHQTFAATASIRVKGARDDDTGGSIHGEIAEHFPRLAPLLHWHLCSTDGPMHYAANTVFHASDRDYCGLLKGERRQLRNGRTGLPCWQLKVDDGTNFGADIPSRHESCDAAERPEGTSTLRWFPWWTIGEGKERDLAAARKAAVWPEATDEDLCADPTVLREQLAARLPALLARFRAAMESCGFQWVTP